MTKTGKVILIILSILIFIAIVVAIGIAIYFVLTNSKTNYTPYDGPGANSPS